MAKPSDDRCLVLWDIDHTLIETRGLGRQLYGAAFQAVTGQPLEHAVDPTGLTETAIFAETLRRHGIEISGDLQARYAAELAREYEANADELRAKGRALPGAYEALAALAERAGVVQTVLTGNLRAVAEIKLRVFGLDGFVDWKIGSYGEDASERAELVGVAQGRAARKLGGSFDRDNTVIVGDTSQDVRAARDGGARIVAVASGRESGTALRQAGAGVVLSDLADTGRLVEAVQRAVEK